MNCFCDILHIKSTAITYNAATATEPSNLLITLPNVTLVNGQVYTLSICQSLPTIPAGDNPQVMLVINSTPIPVEMQIGNYVRANALKCRRRLTLVYGTDPLHTTVLSPCLRG
nr:MAG TPA: hypothetical protein [Caudoviricetes sp.]